MRAEQKENRLRGAVEQTRARRRSKGNGQQGASIGWVFAVKLSPRTFTLDFLTSDRMRVLMASRGDSHVNARVLWRKRRLKEVQPEVGKLSQQTSFAGPSSRIKPLTLTTASHHHNLQFITNVHISSSHTNTEMSWLGKKFPAPVGKSIDVEELPASRMETDEEFNS